MKKNKKVKDPPQRCGLLVVGNVRSSLEIGKELGVVNERMFAVANIPLVRPDLLVLPRLPVAHLVLLNLNDPSADLDRIVLAHLLIVNQLLEQGRVLEPDIGFRIDVGGTLRPGEGLASSRRFFAEAALPPQ